jgi:hypothetical protein
MYKVRSVTKNDPGALFVRPLAETLENRDLSYASESLYGSTK